MQFSDCILNQTPSDSNDINAYFALWCVTCHQINIQAATNYIKPGPNWPKLWNEEAEPERQSHDIKELCGTWASLEEENTYSHLAS